MREKLLVLHASFCDLNLYPDGPQTYVEAKKAGRQLCPHFEACDNGVLDPETGFQCVMMFGLQVAQYYIKQGTTIAKEMGDFRKANIHPRLGWIYSPDRKVFSIIPDDEMAVQRVEHFAHVALGSSDPAEHWDPRLTAVGPDFSDVCAYATTKDGAVDLAKMEELEGRYGYNGGQGCDVLSGPCSCGAWH